MEEQIIEQFIPEEEFPELAEIQTLDEIAANRIVRRIRLERDAIARIERQEADEIDMIRRRAEELRNAHTERIEFLEGTYGSRLMEYAKQSLEGAKERSVKLLSGTIGFRRSPAALEITDRDSLLEWAKANLPDAIKIEESVLKTPVKKHIEATGEVPPGAEYREGEDRFYID